jgi:unsaturated chondroitin disaccharide hydrolase
MNLQLLFWGADHGGPPSWREMALEHARTAARDFVRSDGSTFHVVEYDPATGAVRARGTAQGYAPWSTWSRGQAWAIYGFSAAFRETRDPALLSAARRVADWYLAHVPPDHIPFWDFDAPQAPAAAPRDSSAAAVAASGLLDLAALDPVAENRVKYSAAARETIVALSSPHYLSRTQGGAALLHGALNYWSPSTIDVGLSFGDYFFIESLMRLRSFDRRS